MLDLTLLPDGGASWQLVESLWNPAKRRSEIRILVNCGRAEDPQVTLAIEKHLLPDAVDDSGLLEAVIRAEAIGRPVSMARVPLTGS